MGHKDFHINKANEENLNLGVNLNSWKLLADQFYLSSEVLFKQIESDLQIIIRNHNIKMKTGRMIDRSYTPMLDHVYFLLIGYCLENMMKGFILFNDKKFIEGGKIANSIKSHDLGKLGLMASVQFTENEKQLFDFITPIIQWYGKYPLPAKAKDTIRSSAHNIHSVRDIFLIIYQKLSDKMQATGALKEHLHNYKPSSI